MKNISIFEVSMIFIALLLGFLATFFGWVIYLITTDNLMKKPEIFISEEYIASDITVDQSNIIGKVEAPWTGFVQGGEEQKNMFVGFEEKMMKLKPSYIRIDHIFDDDYYGVVKSDGSLDFSKLDETVISIQKMGARPFFSLTYMPSYLAETKISVPRDWSKWQWLVGETIKHYSGKNGLNMTNIYYEVWNEPDLESFGSFKYYGDKSYLDLYYYAALAAKSLKNDTNINKFKIGGPSITALYKNWVVSLVNMAESKDLPLDFISWHRYSYSPSVFAKDYEDLESWVGNEKYEFIISEWGPDSEKTNIYSGYLAAAYSVAVMAESLDSLDWSYVFEVKDGPNQENFGWGIFRHENNGGAFKPRYHAFNYMKDLTGERISLSGFGSNIRGWGTKRENEINVILTNYNVGNNGVEEFPLKFVNLRPNGEYRFKWEKLQGESDEKVIKVDADGKIEEKFVLKANDILKITLKEISLVSEEELTGFDKIGI